MVSGRWHTTTASLVGELLRQVKRAATVKLDVPDEAGGGSAEGAMAQLNQSEGEDSKPAQQVGAQPSAAQHHYTVGCLPNYPSRGG